MTNPDVQPYTVLLVDPDARQLAVLREHIAACCFVQEASSEADARAILDRVPVHVLMVCDLLPHAQSVALCAHAAARFPDTIRIIYGGDASAERLLDAINQAQVWRYLPGKTRDGRLTALMQDALAVYNLHASHSAFVEEMRSSNEMLKREVERYTREIVTLSEELHIVLDQMQTVVATDELTGLLNRRALLEQLDRLVKQSRRYHTPVSCIIATMGHFDDYILAYGMEGAERLQQAVAERVRAHLRDVDLSARVGDGDFAMALPMTGQEGARVVAERMVRVLAEAPYVLEDVTVSARLSFGVAEMLPSMRDAEDLFSRAQSAALSAHRKALSPPVLVDEEATTMTGPGSPESRVPSPTSWEPRSGDRK